MALANSEWLRGSRVYRRIGAMRLALGAVAVVLGALWLFGALSAMPALAAFVLIAVADPAEPRLPPSAPLIAAIVDSRTSREQIRCSKRSWPACRSR